MSECRLYDPPPRPPAHVVERLGGLPTAVVSDSQGRIGGAPGVNLIGPPRARMAGTAFTVKTRPGDNLVVHKALEVAEPGDVLTIDAGGAIDRAIVGQLICRYAQGRGLAGIVVDGAVRDLEEIVDGTFPVFAKAVCHQGPYKDGPGALQGPVSIAGTAVRSGDVVIGDADGIVVVDRQRASEVADAAHAVLESEQDQLRAINESRWDRTWIDSRLTYTHSPQP